MNPSETITPAMLEQRGKALAALAVAIERAQQAAAGPRIYQMSTSNPRFVSDYTDAMRSLRLAYTAAGEFLAEPSPLHERMAAMAGGDMTAL